MVGRGEVVVDSGLIIEISIPDKNRLAVPSLPACQNMSSSVYRNTIFQLILPETKARKQKPAKRKAMLCSMMSRNE